MDENRSRDLINALIISHINKRDNLTRLIHFKLFGYKFCFILYSPFYSKDFDR